MNKRIFKFIPAALAMVALASCNADDVWESSASNENNAGSLVVNIESPVEIGNSMRSSFYKGNDGKDQRIFNTNDWLRVYDEFLQKYDRYQYQTADVFTTTDKNVSKDNATYTFFPSDMVEYGTWKPETGIFALMKLAVYDGAANKEDGHLYYAEETRTVDGKTVLAYTSNIPEFGVVDNTNTEKLVGTNVYLTGMLRVKIQNGAGNVKTIRVRSLTENDELNKDMPLWGYFEADLDTEHAMSTSVNESKLVKSSEKLATNFAKEQDEKLATLYVDLDAEQMKNYTSYVYIPIIATDNLVNLGKKDPAAVYEKLVVDYLEEGKDSWEDDAVEVATFENQVIYAHGSYVNGKKADEEAVHEMVIEGGDITVTPKLNGLKEINDALVKYAAVEGNEITINVVLGEEGLTIPNLNDGNFTPEAKKLLVPELTKDIVLNITSGSFKGEDLIIEDLGKVGTGKLTIKLSGTSEASTSTKVVSNSGHAIALVGATEDNTFAGVEVDNAQCEFTLGAKMTGDITVKKADKFILAINPGNDVVAGGEGVQVNEIVVDAAIYNNITTTDAAVTVTEKGSVNSATITTESGDVTIFGGVTFVTTTSGFVTISGVADANKQGNIGNLTTGGDVKIDLLKEAEAIRGKMTLNGKEEQTIILNQGYIKAIDATAAKKVTVTHETGMEKLTAVKTVTTPEDNDNVTFEKSTWNGEYIGDSFKSDYVNTDVYTASQFATKTLENGAIILNADIDLNNIAWGKQSRVLSGAFSGRFHTIYNLNLTLENKNFGMGLFVNMGGSESLIQRVTIDGVTVDNKNKLSKIGVFAGTVSGGKKTFSEVEVKNVKYADGSNAERTIVGGLIGYVDEGAEVELKSVKTAGAIEGYHSLGGFIGGVAATGTVTIDKDCSTTATINRTFNSAKDQDLEYLKVGRYIGTIAKDADVTITTAVAADVNKALNAGITADFKGKMQKGYQGTGETYNFYDIVFEQTLIGYSDLVKDTKANIAVGTAKAAEYIISEYAKGDKDSNKYLYYVNRPE